MPHLWMVTFFGLFLLSVLQFCMGLYLAHHIGILYSRVGRRESRLVGGPDIGKLGPDFVVKAIDGTEVRRSSYPRSALMLVFWSLGCRQCESLTPGLRTFIRRESARIRFVVIASLSSASEQSAFSQLLLGGGTPIVNSSQIYNSYRISKTPYAVLIDQEGIVLSAGVVDEIMDLEKLTQGLRRVSIL